MFVWDLHVISVTYIRQKQQDNDVPDFIINLVVETFRVKKLKLNFYHSI